MKEGSKRKMVGDGKEERAFLGFIFQATSAIIFTLLRYLGWGSNRYSKEKWEKANLGMCREKEGKRNEI